MLASSGPKQVGFASGWQQVHRVAFGLQWLRRRQHSLTRGVLALFCAAWLQAAIVPCVMAHAADVTSQVQSPARHPHDPHAGHDHAAVAPEPQASAPSHPCPYCPPAACGGGSCDAHGGCAYPHEPQADARAAGVIFAALPVAFVVPAAGRQVIAGRADTSVPDVVSKVSLAVSYCRFIE